MIIKDRKPNIIPNYIYFYHLDEFFVIPLYPDQITDSMESKFATTNALSRSAPVFTYSNSGPRTVQLSFDLHRDLVNDLNKNISNVKLKVQERLNQDDYIDTLIKYLQSVSLPKYNLYKNGSKSVQPPEVAVRFGNDIFIKGVVTSSISVTYKKPITENNKYACVAISFTISETDPYDAVKVANVGSFRGLIAGGLNDIYNKR